MDILLSPLDINECATNKGGCVYGCENLPGGFRCTCPEGMMLAEDKLSCRPCKFDSFIG